MSVHLRPGHLYTPRYEFRLVTTCTRVTITGRITTRSGPIASPGELFIFLGDHGRFIKLFDLTEYTIQYQHINGIVFPKHQHLLPTMFEEKTSL